MKFIKILNCAYKLEIVQIFFKDPESGSIAWRHHLLLTVPCTSSLRKFPFDEVVCNLNIMPNEFESEFLQVQWGPRGVTDFESDGSLPDFFIESIEKEIGATAVGMARAPMSRMEVTIRFRRYQGFFVMQGYIPHTLTVVITGFSFFLNPQSMHVRAGFGISTFLAMIFQYGAILNSLPKVGYVKVKKSNREQKFYSFSILNKIDAKTM